MSVPGDMLAFSHLRWSWVYQWPQHLMTRAAQGRRVFFVEEPILTPDVPHLTSYVADAGVTVVTPNLPPGLTAEREHDTLRNLMAELVDTEPIQPTVLWYFTPAAMPFTVDLGADLVVYDCMDELAVVPGASPALHHQERQLLSRADLVFTGGPSLFEAKRGLHANLYVMPSGVDLEHFRCARGLGGEDAWLASVPHPRIGYAGVLDERLDLELLHAMVAHHPEWHFIFAGPVTNVEPDVLPLQGNVHYLGQLAYQRLPAAFASWDVAWIPFAHNSATQYINPTKTPEYLAAGLRVISTPIRDVVHTWGDHEAVTIASTATECAEGIRRSISAPLSSAQLRRSDRELAFHSWDDTWNRMAQLMEQVGSNAA